MCIYKTRQPIEEPSPQNIIACGNLGVVHKLNGQLVRKLPSNPSNPNSLRAIKTEARIYQHLQKHKRIARCLSATDDHVDLRYESHGDLASYLHNHTVTERFRICVAQQAIEAIHYIHEKEVIHSDLSARQFLLDGRLNLRLCDFSGSSLKGSDALVLENASHFLPRDEDAPNTVCSDIFALGSTLYEIFAGKMPYAGLSEEEILKLYCQKVFPDLSMIKREAWRRVITKCWHAEYNNTAEIFGEIHKRSWICYRSWLRLCPNKTTKPAPT
ncbi:kinase-like protein [Xylona heveae TC161]|uniref:Kinase-like protein n=1 Tax=Xylona heveae (strain CBS 132557 / TC161) TaxID=1328760 RepID=A0A165GKQ3_XYLHT|nr:kinase-like protein [Xylona heveae TC161]KZF22309.1 kinase-like protein [Xylona heveae TC161]